MAEHVMDMAVEDLPRSKVFNRKRKSSHPHTHQIYRLGFEAKPLRGLLRDGLTVADTEQAQES